MKINKGSIIYIVIGIAIIAFVYSKIGIEQVLINFKGRSPLIIALYIAIVIIIDILLVLRWKVILLAHKIDISFKKLILYKEAGYAVGYITPQMHIGDSSTRILFLKKDGVDVKKSLSTVLVDRAMTITTDAIVGIIGVLLIILGFALPTNLKIIMLGFSCLIGFGFGIFYYRMLSGKSFITPIFRIFMLNKIKFFQKAAKGTKDVEKQMYMFFRHNLRAFVFCIIINIIVWLMMIFEYKLALLLMGHDANFIEIFLIIAFVGMAYFLPVPFAAGVLEAGQLSVNKLINISSSFGLGLSLLIRTKDMIRTGIGLMVLSYYGVKIDIKKILKRN
ncbi:MAG: lysylphosphatidylglycerol synthase transmembrane domain-containing protein [archaeon]